MIARNKQRWWAAENKKERKVDVVRFSMLGILNKKHNRPWPKPA